MDEAKGSTVVRAAVRALTAGAAPRYQEAFAPTCMRWTLGAGDAVPAGAVAEVLHDLHRAFDGFHLDEELLLDAGRHVVARWRTSGTHVAEYAGIAPTGRTFSVQTCEIYQLDGDAVVATWAYGDPMDLVRQLTEPG
jgi:predicted ester cyclase